MLIRGTYRKGMGHFPKACGILFHMQCGFCLSHITATKNAALDIWSMVQCCAVVYFPNNSFDLLVTSFFPRFPAIFLHPLVVIKGVPLFLIYRKSIREQCFCISICWCYSSLLPLSCNKNPWWNTFSNCWIMYSKYVVSVLLLFMLHSSSSLYHNHSLLSYFTCLTVSTNGPPG